MTIKEAVRTHLLADDEISGLVGRRMKPLPLETNTELPAVTISLPSDAPQTTLDGDDGNLNNIRVQIDVWAETNDAAYALAELIRTRMQTAAASFRAVPISIFEEYETETRRHRYGRDYSCWYRPT